MDVFVYVFFFDSSSSDSSESGITCMSSSSSLLLSPSAFSTSSFSSFPLLSYSFSCYFSIYCSLRMSSASLSSSSTIYSSSSESTAYSTSSLASCCKLLICSSSTVCLLLFATSYSMSGSYSAVPFFYASIAVYFFAATISCLASSCTLE